MSGEIEEAERLRNKLEYWAKTLNVPISDIEEDAAKWLESVSESDDPKLQDYTEFIGESVASHTPENPILILLQLTAAAMLLLCFDRTNRLEKPGWPMLIRAAEHLSMLEGLVGSTVFEMEARTLKFSKCGKKGAQAKHQRIAKLKEWAVAQAQDVRGSDMDISRSLVHQLPAELVDASKSPQRAIYDALRDARKKKT